MKYPETKREEIVDEIVEIPWESPLKTFTENKTITDGLETVFNMASDQINISSNDYDKLTSLMQLTNYTNSYKDLYEINLQINNIEKGLHEIITQIKINIPILNHEIKINFKAEICTLLNQLSAKMKEVNFSLLN